MVPGLPWRRPGTPRPNLERTAQTEFVASRQAGDLQRSERSNERYVKIVGSAIGERRGKMAQGA